MRCFLACFGISKNRKHRKAPNRVKYTNQMYGSYEHLDSHAKTESISNSSESSGRRGKAISSSGIKKKVSFNLNVKSYEPLPHVEYTDQFSESEEDVCEGNMSGNYDSNSDNLETKAFPSDHRYKNWQESDDDMAFEESDVDDYGSDSDSDDEEMSEKEYLDESEASIDFDQLCKGENGNDMTLGSSLDQELKKLGCNSKAKRDRSEYVFSVLNPIENLAQWKAVKGKVPMPSKRQRKENVGLNFDCKTNISEIKPLMQDMSVNTSLSSWLGSSKSNKSAAFWSDN